MSESTVIINAGLVRADQKEEAVAKECRILKEHHLEVYVNEQLVVRLVCTASDLEQLVIGRLITERIISDVSEIEQLYLCDSGNRVRVFLKNKVIFNSAQREEPSCCPDNRVLLSREKISFVPLPKAVCRPEWIFHLVNAFAEDSGLHRSTGGTHSCMLAVGDEVLFKTEDIGRHNAMDKAIGFAAQQRLCPAECILFTTGRVPTDMVRKAVAAGIPVLVSKAVPTEDAVEMAKNYGLTLICRAWPDSYEIYAENLC